MNSAEAHRIQPALGRVEFFDYSQDEFSAFDFLARKFKCSFNPYPLQRCFSMARSKRCKSFVMEKISSVGLLAEERSALANGNFKNVGSIFRLSFWRRELRCLADLNMATNRELLGYAIVKRDKDFESKPGWYVFESVFIKYNHHLYYQVLP